MTYYSARATGLLNRSPLLHMDMLESIRRGHAQMLEVTDRSVLLRDLPSGAVMLSAADEESARGAVLAAPPTALFVAHQPWLLDAIQAELRLPRRMVCWQAVYPADQPLPVPPAADIRQLDLAYLPLVASHYSTAGGPDYVRQRLAAGVMYGAFVGGELAGFIGTHPEGSIGMLEVLPAWRRRGLATALESYLIGRMRARGYTPFAQIVEDNAPSLALQQKLGLSLAEGRVFWLTRPE